jgi:hypothetical protein
MRKKSSFAFLEGGRGKGHGGAALPARLPLSTLPYLLIPPKGPPSAHHPSPTHHIHTHTRTPPSRPSPGPRHLFPLSASPASVRVPCSCGSC